MAEKEKNKEIAITVKNLHITYRGLKKTSIRASWKHFGDKVELFHALKGVSLICVSKYLPIKIDSPAPKIILDV